MVWVEELTPVLVWSVPDDVERCEDPTRVCCDDETADVMPEEWFNDSTKWIDTSIRCIGALYSHPSNVTDPPSK